MKRDREAVALLRKLIAIPGPSKREEKVVAFIRDRVRRIRGVRIVDDGANRRIPGGGSCGNLVVRVPGTRGGRRRMMCAHMDTVAIAVGSRPVVRGKTIVPAGHTALGSDNRSGCAVLLRTLAGLRGRKHPPLTFLFTVQEEIGLLGSRHVRRGALGAPCECLNVDGSRVGEICVGAPGSYAFTARVRGVASHAGVAPEKGVSAALVFARALERIDRQGFFGRIRKGRSGGTSNIGIVEGGTGINVVMDELCARGEMRSYDDRFLRRIVRTYENAFRGAAKRTRSAAGKRASVVIEKNVVYRTFTLERTAPVVRRVSAACRAERVEPKLICGGGGLDANWLHRLRIPTATIGAGGQSPHTYAERLSIPDFLKSCRIALAYATG